MITQEQLQALAKKTMEDFIAKCNCDTREDAADALLRITAMAGLAMCMLVGKQDALARMEAAMEHVAEQGRDAPVPEVTVQ